MAAEKKKRQPTVTALALLSLLNIRSFSTYELAQLMTRGLELTWPRVGRSTYFEAKKLAELGLATASKETENGRERTVYTITDEGRAAVQEWHAGREISAGAPESEAMLRIIFGEQGTKEDLMAAARDMRERAEHGILVERMARIREMVERGTPFPDRLHIITLSFPWFEEWGMFQLRYARWVEEVVSQWPDVDDPAAWHQIDEFYESRLDGSLGTVGPSAPNPGEPKVFPMGDGAGE